MYTYGLLGLRSQTATLPVVRGYGDFNSQRQILIPGLGSTVISRKKINFCVIWTSFITQSTSTHPCPCSVLYYVPLALALPSWSCTWNFSGSHTSLASLAPLTISSHGPSLHLPLLGYPIAVIMNLFLATSRLTYRRHCMATGSSPRCIQLCIAPQTLQEVAVFSLTQRCSHRTTNCLWQQSTSYHVWGSAFQEPDETTSMLWTWFLNAKLEKLVPLS